MRRTGREGGGGLSSRAIQEEKLQKLDFFFFFFFLLYLLSNLLRGISENGVGVCFGVFNLFKGIKWKNNKNPTACLISLPLKP